MILRAKKILEQEIEGLLALPIDDRIEQAVNMILACQGKIVITGMGKAGIIAKKIAATMSSTGTPAIFIHAGETQHGDLGIVSNQDLIIALSNSGKTYEVLLFLELAKKTFTCPVIGISGLANSEFSKYCDLNLEIGKVKEVCPFGLAPTTSTTCMLMLGDILSVLVMEEKQFTLEKYGTLHHGGYLGSMIREINGGKD